MKTRKLVIGLVFSMILAGSGVVLGQETKVPSDQLIVKLLTLESERLPSDYRVAIVLPGEMRGRAGFVAEKVAKVTFVGPVIEDGRKVRRVCDEQFYWNADYGWFHYEIGEDRRGAVVWVWSELRGEVEVR